MIARGSEGEAVSEMARCRTQQDKFEILHAFHVVNRIRREINYVLTARAL